MEALGSYNTLGVGFSLTKHFTVRSSVSLQKESDLGTSISKVRASQTMRQNPSHLAGPFGEQMKTAYKFPQCK